MDQTSPHIHELELSLALACPCFRCSAYSAGCAQTCELFAAWDRAGQPSHLAITILVPDHVHA